MIDDAILQYAGELLRNKILERSCVQKVCVWYTPKSYLASVNMRVDFVPVAQSGMGFVGGSEWTHIPGGLLAPLDERMSKLLIDYAVGELVRLVERRAPKIVPQKGVLEVLPVDWQETLPEPGAERHESLVYP